MRVAKISIRKETAMFYLLISPWVVGFLAFVLGPMLVSLSMSMMRWDLLTPPRWIGLRNFTQAFSNDPLFFQALKVTFSFSIFSVPLRLLVSLFIAILLRQITVGIKIFRLIYYVPVVVSGVAAMVLWSFIFNPLLGLLNQFLRIFGINGPGWIFDPNWRCLR